MVTGWFADLCVTDVSRSRDFYCELLGLGVLVDHGWYAELGVDGRVVLALVRARHPTVPSAAGAPARGVLVSFEVDDARAVAARVAVPFVLPLADELGQRHFMIADPDGTIVDVIERIAFVAEDRRLLARYRRC